MTVTAVPVQAPVVPGDSRRTIRMKNNIHSTSPSPPTYILIDDQMIPNQLLKIEILNWSAQSAHSIHEKCVRINTNPHRYFYPLLT